MDEDLNLLKTAIIKFLATDEIYNLSKVNLHKLKDLDEATKSDILSYSENFLQQKKANYLCSAYGIADYFFSNLASLKRKTKNLALEQFEFLNEEIDIKIQNAKSETK